MQANPDRFRLFGPDEVSSNRLDGVFEVTDRAFVGATVDGDEHLSPNGRVVEVLSEHLCEGWAPPPRTCARPWWMPRQECRDHTRRYGEDAPQVRDWVWPH